MGRPLVLPSSSSWLPWHAFDRCMHGFVKQQQQQQQQQQQHDRRHPPKKRQTLLSRRKVKIERSANAALLASSLPNDDPRTDRCGRGGATRGRTVLAALDPPSPVPLVVCEPESHACLSSRRDKVPFRIFTTDEQSTATAWPRVVCALSYYLTQAPPFDNYMQRDIGHPPPQIFFPLQSCISPKVSQKNSKALEPDPHEPPSKE
jgi:hypothetical protein